VEEVSEVRGARGRVRNHLPGRTEKVRRREEHFLDSSGGARSWPDRGGGFGVDGGGRWRWGQPRPQAKCGANQSACPVAVRGLPRKTSKTPRNVRLRTERTLCCEGRCDSPHAPRPPYLSPSRSGNSARAVRVPARKTRRGTPRSML